MWSILISSQLGIPNLSQSRDYFRAVVNNKACGAVNLSKNEVVADMLKKEI